MHNDSSTSFPLSNISLDFQMNFSTTVSLWKTLCVCPCMYVDFTFKNKGMKEKFDEEEKINSGLAKE